MKKAVIVIAIAVIGISLSAPNQNAKIGFVNLEKIMIDMPQMMEINQEVENFTKKKNEELMQESINYGKKYQEFESNKTEYSEKKLSKVKLELDEMAIAVQELSDKNKKLIISKKSQLSKPILKKIKKQLKTFCKEKGYTALFDSENESILFSSKANDVTNIVKEFIIK